MQYIAFVKKKKCYKKSEIAEKCKKIVRTVFRTHVLITVHVFCHD